MQIPFDLPSALREALVGFKAIESGLFLGWREFHRRVLAHALSLPLHVNAQLTVMQRHSLGIDYSHAIAFKQPFHGAERPIGNMFVINRVESHLLNHIQKIVHLDDKHAAGLQDRPHAPRLKSVRSWM